MVLFYINYLMEFKSIINFIILYSLIFIIICFICFYFFYKYTINKFSNNYDNLIKILKNVDNNKLNFMNFGYWEDDYMSLTNANKKLCDFVINQFKNREGTLLDIGCGYGEQDFYWNETHKYKITALDISKKQIDYGIEKALKQNIDDIKFLQCDATNLPFDNNKFDNIVCLESAFHYKPRINFFNESFRVLNDGGELVIADIVLKTNQIGIMKSIFIHFFKELLSIPDENLITAIEYVDQLKKAGFEVEIINISDKTFKPYFNHFSKNHHFSFYFYDKIIEIINNNIEDIPFEYYIFKCKKI